ncbi:MULTISPECIES: hypothetical protein [unclassified Caballeronia]|jgi:hypothetical protein|uniref:hypothetical protein n=1 Tax=unclassified Caballeronia TaxID=2646786 RepID=UPI002863303A|nr:MULTISPECIES: hypothetical protein [unclassified Caballeronia]MDR5754293.1 hypothetical protein [Caballeronia sp. LZ024]MDR5840671.1 hypothetical protein [Caballeronia sp. LZ031]
MAPTHKPSSIVLSYAQHEEQLLIHVVETDKLSALTAQVLEAPILLSESDFRLDDEFARELGVSLLNVLALSHPHLSQYMTATQTPLPRDE